MPYCKHCGAYIPDGLTDCLACGYSESENQAGAAAQRQEKRSDPQRDEELRDVMERHRQLQQEKNRQWAEQEKARRDQQNENRRWASEEYARRLALQEREKQQRRREEELRRKEEELRAREARARGWEESAETQKESFDSTPKTSGNTALAALSYLSFFFVAPFLFAPQDEFARYHAKQGLRLFIFSAIADVVGAITGVGWILSLFRIYCIIKGIGNALNGKREPLPYIGTIGKN